MDQGKRGPDSLVGRIPEFSRTGTACAARTVLEVGLLEVGLVLLVSIRHSVSALFLFQDCYCCLERRQSLCGSQ
jgi:hypothetical protein